MAPVRILLVTCICLSSVTLLTALVPNLHSGCLKCLCEAASDCNRAHGCSHGYCGPFKVSRVYWVDAGRHVMKEDVSEREGAYEDCARQYYCATKIIENYMNRFGKDCNGDGVIDCDDYAMIHFNGGYGCGKSLVGTSPGYKYFKCRPPKNGAEALLRRGSFP